MRKSEAFALFIMVDLILLGLVFVNAGHRRALDSRSIEETANMVETLQLSDLCLFTEARYTRNPSVADINTPFQDYPLSFDHFPSGSLICLPPHLKPHTGSRPGHEMD